MRALEADRAFQLCSCVYRSGGNAAHAGRKRFVLILSDGLKT